MKTSTEKRAGIRWTGLLGKFICEVCKDIFPPIKEWPLIIGAAVVGTVIVLVFVAPVAWLYECFVQPKPDDKEGPWMAAVCFWMLVIGAIEFVKYLRQKWKDIFLPNVVITDPHRGRVSATEKGNEP